MSYEKLMADGTVCRTGPACKRHGSASASGMNSFLSSLKARIAAPKSDVAYESSYSNQSLPDATFSSTKILKGVNAYYKGRVDESDEGYEDTQASKPAALRQLDLESKEFAETMPQELRDTISHYVSSYEFVNNYLRTGEQGIRDYLNTYKNPEIFFPDMNKSVAEYVEMAKVRVQNMDEAFNTYKRPEQNVRRLFRSELIPKGTSIEQHLANFSPETVITNPSYTSTSVDSDYMLVFNAPHENKNRIVVYEMLSKDGIPVHTYDDFPGSPSFSEREVLLARGTSFKVKNVTTRKFISSYPDKKPAGSHGSKGIPSAEYVVVQMEQVN